MATQMNVGEQLEELSIQEEMKLLLPQMVLMTQDHLQDVFMMMQAQQLQMVFVMLRMVTSNLMLMEKQL